MNNLNELFEQLKSTGDWNNIYGPLLQSTRAIAASHKIPVSEAEDILQNVMLSTINKIDQIDHVGYILAAIKFSCCRWLRNVKLYDNMLKDVYEQYKTTRRNIEENGHG
jgi:hypothetical protein